MRDLGGGSGWLAGGRAGQGVCGCGRWVGWAGGVEEEEEEAWAVVLLGLGFFLGLLGGFLHLQEERGRDPQSLLIGLVGCFWSDKCNILPASVFNVFWGCGLRTSLVLASPFSEWFSSLASASAFSFAFLVFLSSFLSFTAFSFCILEENGGHAVRTVFHRRPKRSE